MLRTTIINCITAAVAFGIAANRRRNPPLSPTGWPPGVPAPYVEIIVPARNEERNIARLLASMAAQRYPAGRWGITVVDDHSTDCTAAIVRRFCAEIGNLRLVVARDLPPRWTGKNNAMFSGYLGAPRHSDYLLFVDADTEFDPEMLAAIVLGAQRHRALLLSLVLDMELRTFWQRLLVPQIGELYSLLAGTMDAVNRETGPAAANGQCMLVGYPAYARYGALPGVRSDMAEDRALAAAMKRHGETIRLEHGQMLGRVRAYATFAEAWAGFTKTLYWAAGLSTPRILAVLLALEMYAHLPLWDLVSGLRTRGGSKRKRALVHAALRLAPMLLVRLYVCRVARVPYRYAPLYPIAVAMGNAMLLTSWLNGRSRRGVTWKDRAYAAADLRNEGSEN